MIMGTHLDFPVVLLTGDTANTVTGSQYLRKKEITNILNIFIHLYSTLYFERSVCKGFKLYNERVTAKNNSKHWFNLSSTAA